MTASPSISSSEVIEVVCDDELELPQAASATAMSAAVAAATIREVFITR